MPPRSPCSRAPPRARSCGGRRTASRRSPSPSSGAAPAGSPGAGSSSLAGAGNNGGDGLWAGDELRRRGVAVTAVLLSPDRAHPAGLAALRRQRGRIVTDVEHGVAAVDHADLVLDAIVGTGAAWGPAARGGHAGGRRAVAGVPILAVDTPSGVDPLTGVPGEHHVRAAATVTFGARKPVHVLAAPLAAP